MTNDTADVAIIGAGPVGAALALRLAAGGQRVVLVDRAALPPMEHPDFDGRAYAIAYGSRDLLDRAGLWDRLPFPPCPIERIRVSDGKPGRPPSPLFLDFDHRDVGDEPFGWIVEARSLRMAINRALADSAVILHAPATARVTRDADGATVAIADGPSYRVNLVVAADGRGSTLRAEAGIAVTRYPYRQSAVVCAVEHERPHHNVALEHFLPGGPFAQLPMSDADGAHLSAIVFTESHANAARLAAMDDPRFTIEVARRLGAHLGRIRLVGRRWTYPLSALHAHRYHATRLVLVGDSAHGVHPIAGQGLNLGLQDGIALAELIDAAADPGSPDLLARYQRIRRPANIAMLAATDALDRLFSTDLPPVRLVRDIGLAAVNRMPRLKRRFMRTAMGLRA
ncbi:MULTISPECIES: UbiH/UbiF/VisC/COQ6 family ubiquinone biosynthesis hydroxylase [Acidiphilium]|uniref:Putative oxidoreductase n=1 Tax=Acidiphilium multivorum (strain DSM 11245 / JCM 8867 / NBRC 100883 / AIU 301) TaxID=926570 RepID=F0J3F8_ACIMA|nr:MULTISPECIES: UbiH/UbiF/VisC/COQ6 family ubiquinone biosynthesis hydroxylase [Acidiphilium]MBS3024997.1 UbiH/UbiF/VisC/COQ6 family ubiquinone biosynthesis hydroxylase [Acidiphilium multivorum]BAJ79814.1 putative oxidoreductase [Acidiphilium multivorum AIU301]GAN73022.1 hydroxylase/monooxygenase [Acidiphilium multivorum AIU301]